MNLRELAIKHGANKIWPLTADYLDAYELFFGRLANTEIDLLEIGVESGGSLKMWHEFFPKAKITGIDIDKECRKFACERIEIITGDQGDRGFIEEFAKDKSFDIVIDDGSHKVEHQRSCFKRLWNTVKSGGFYVVEDLHTSYWPKWGGKYGGSNTMVEYLKTIFDNINHKAVSHEKAEGHKTQLTPMGARSIHIYSGICFIERE